MNESKPLSRALGAELVQQRAGEGDMEAQWSLGSRLVTEAYGFARRSQKANVGLAPRTAQLKMTRRCSYLICDDQM